jgi:hypothetical protein
LIKMFRSIINFIKDKIEARNYLPLSGAIEMTYKTHIKNNICNIDLSNNDWQKVIYNKILDEHLNCPTGAFLRLYGTTSGFYKKRVEFYAPECEEYDYKKNAVTVRKRGHVFTYMNVCIHRKLFLSWLKYQTEKERAECTL